MTINQFNLYPKPQSDKQYIDQYIDHCVIDDYADKDLNCGYNLQACDLPSHEQQNIVSILLEKDEVLKEKVQDYIQLLIDARLNEMESRDRFYFELERTA